MSKLVLSCVFLLGFVSCQDGAGTLSVFEKITLKDRKGDAVVFEEGSHSVSLNYKKKLFSKKKVIELKSKGRKKVVVNIPKGTSIPKYNGSVKLTAKQAKQPFDILASVQTDSFDSEPQIRKDHCEIKKEYKKCIVAEDGTRSHKTKTARLDGFERVEYYKQTTLKDIQFELSKPNTDEIVASFNGGESKTSTVTTFRSKCRLRAGELEKFRFMAIKEKSCRK